MAEDVSNKTLIALLVVAIFVSLGGTLLSLNKLGSVRYLSGMATSGTAEITIPTVVSLTVTESINVTGVVVNGTDAYAYGTVVTDESATNLTGSVNFTLGLKGTVETGQESLNVTNDGTGTKINVTMVADKTDELFIGTSSTGVDALWKSLNDTGNTAGTGCFNLTVQPGGEANWTEADSGSPDLMCSGLEVGAAFNVYMNASLPDDTPGSTTPKIVVLTFTAGPVA